MSETTQSYQTLGERVAVFTRSQVRDYEWVERGNAPDTLFRLAEWAASLDTTVWAVIVGDQSWILRSRPVGAESGNRLIKRAEIFRLASDTPVNPLDALALVTEGSAGDGEQTVLFEARIPPPSGVVVSEEKVAAARLGLPLAVTSDEAREIVSQPPWRYTGICGTRGNEIVPWHDDLRHFLTIRAAQPRRSSEEQQLLTTGLALRDPRRWELLDSLSLPDAHQMLARRNSGVITSAWIEWQALELQGEDAVARTLERLRIAPYPWPAHAEKAILRDVGEAGLQSLRDVVYTNVSAIGADTLETLCTHGYLKWLGGEFIVQWAPFANGSDCARRFLIAQVTQQLQLDIAVVEWILWGENGRDWQMTALRQAFDRIVMSRRFRPSDAAVFDLVARSGREDQQFLNLMRGNLTGRARALVDLTLHGSAGESEALEPEDFGVALAARRRLFGDGAALDMIKNMLHVRSHEFSVVALTAWRNSDRSDAVARIVIAVTAYLHDRQMEEPLPQVLLQQLIERELISAANVFVRNREELLAMSAISASTRPLASLLAPQPSWSGTPEIPAAWRDLCRTLLTPRLLSPVARDLGRAESAALAEFAVGLHDLDRNAVAMLRGQSSQPIPLERLESLREWLPVVIRDEGEAAVQIVGMLAEQQTVLDEPVAAGVVSLLLPKVNEPTRDLFLHVLTRRGPLPGLTGVAPRLLARLVPYLDPIPLLDALFGSGSVEAASSDEVIRTVGSHIRVSGAVCPARGYTEVQKRRCSSLTLELSHLPGWEIFADSVDRRDLVLRIIRDHGFTADDLVEVTPQRLTGDRDAEH